MLVISCEKNSFADDQFCNFHKYLGPGDCLVINDTRVFPARLHGRRNHASGADIEVFLIRPLDPEEKTWKALTKPAKRARTGDRLLFAQELSAEIVAEADYGERTLRFDSHSPLGTLLERLGETPLPPYIRRQPDETDRARYQTVFAEKKGSAAAPTAGLHFTPETLDACRSAGASVARVTLHVGLGTFAPLRSGDVSSIQLHEETYEITESECAIMRQAQRLVCVGTTSVRTVETAFLRGGLHAQHGETNLFIYPGFRFRATGAMLTNFHLPESSLLMLVSALAGRELVLAAYQHAVKERYRFFSYGDCMLIV